MKIAAPFIFIISLLCLFAYAAYSNKQMHEDIERTFSSEPIFKKNIGDFQRAMLVTGGSDCGYGNGSCSESTLVFKVLGTQGCIYATAIVEESFPIYKLVSVKPQTYTSQNTTNGIKNGPVITLIRKCAA